MHPLQPLGQGQGRALVRILLTNDDGILAPGLWHAAQALRELGEVTVCAPDREQSGIGGARLCSRPRPRRHLSGTGCRSSR